MFDRFQGKDYALIKKIYALSGVRDMEQELSEQAKAAIEYTRELLRKAAEEEKANGGKMIFKGPLADIRSKGPYSHVGPFKRSELYNDN